MIFDGYPFKTILRDGTSVTIRPMAITDGAAVLTFYRELPEEDRSFLNDDVTDDDWIRRFLAQVDYQSTIPMVAECGGKIVAQASLYRTLHGWMTHVGQVRIAVARSFQRKGLGVAMVRELVRIAIRVGLEKLIARVVEDQIGAKRAFEKLGFYPEAVLKKHVQDIQGNRRNLVIMSNDVSRIWDAMEALLDMDVKSQMY
jgi:RimJ/RimL family protein N-acetyltransferase